MNSCHHCGDVILAAAGHKPSSIRWCATCIDENTNLLNSLETKHWSGAPECYFPGDPSSRAYDGEYTVFADGESADKVAAIPKKGTL